MNTNMDNNCYRIVRVKQTLYSLYCCCGWTTLSGKKIRHKQDKIKIKDIRKTYRNIRLMEQPGQRLLAVTGII